VSADGPLVSVVISFLDEVRFLEGAVQAQTIDDWELRAVTRRLGRRAGR
jgi:hypothetical protein